MKHIVISLTVLVGLGLSSCKKINDLVDPKSGDAKNEALLLGTWQIDSTCMGKTEQSTDVVYDTVILNDGNFEFGPRQGYGVGYLYHTHLVNGITQTDTLNWTSGDWGSSGIEGKRITIFMGRHQDRSFDETTDVHFDFLQKDEKRIRISGTRAYVVPSGATVRYHYRYTFQK